MKFERQQIPAMPGVYIMKDAEGKVLYIGKAVNLRKRVANYFGRETRERYQIKFLMERVASIETIQTRSEKEALLLEYKLVQEYRPKYNIDLKDNKTFLRVKVTMNHVFPAIFVTRRVRKDGDPFSGQCFSMTSGGPGCFDYDDNTTMCMYNGGVGGHLVYGRDR